MKAEIKKLLKEMNCTESQMDEFWKENYDTNFIVRNLTNHGKTWRDLNATVIQQLPTQKQKDLERIQKEKIEKEEKLEAELKEKEDRNYYYEHFEELMVAKIDRKEDLTEQELKEIRDFSIKEIKCDESRWTVGIESILKMCDRHFSLYWNRGLTEMQENEFYNQPVEVEEVIKTITVTEWVPIEKEK